MEERIDKPCFIITQWFLFIYAETHEQFFELYDKAMEQISDAALNKKWNRSYRRARCGQVYGMYKYIVRLNKPTLAKILGS